MITITQHKKYLNDAIIASGLVGTKVVESLTYQQALDAIKAWTLPAIAVLYGGCQRTAPNETSQQKTKSVVMDFDIVLFVATKNRLGSITPEPVNELEKLRNVVQNIKLPSGRSYIFQLEQVLKSDASLTQWLVSFKVAETI